MARFRKKPVVVEAQQWWPPGDSRHDPEMLFDRKGNTVSPPDYRKIGDLYCAIRGDLGMGPAMYMIHSWSNSEVQVHPGDWIITGVKGEKYPCRPDVFEETYEAC